jgi:hypothetical protein
VKLIWKYLKRGFKDKMAYQMATEEMKGGKARAAEGEKVGR